MYIAPASANDPSSSRDGDRDAGRALTLQALAEIGMDLARELRRQVVGPAEDAAPEEAAPDRAAPSMTEAGLAFSRISRAVRLTLALEARLEQDGKAKAAPGAQPLAGSAQEILMERIRRVWRQADEDRETIRGAVERLIEAEAETERAEGLRAALHERLDDEDGDEDLTDGPVGEAIARICRDLGLSPDWAVWRDEDWGLAAAQAARERADAQGAPNSS